MKMVMTKSRSMFLSGFFHNFFFRVGKLSIIIGKKNTVKHTCMIDDVMRQCRHGYLNVAVHLYIQKVYTLEIGLVTQERPVTFAHLCRLNG